MVGSHTVVGNLTERAQTFFTQFLSLASSALTLVRRDHQGTVTGVDTAAAALTPLACAHVCVYVSTVCHCVTHALSSRHGKYSFVTLV